MFTEQFLKFITKKGIKMKKLVFIAIVLMVIFTACSNNQNSSSEKTKNLSEQNYEGTFKGTLPCADCPGQDVVLVFKSNNTYSWTETVEYKGKIDTSTFSGKFNYNKKTSIFSLDNEEQYKFLLEGKLLYFLNKDGKKVEGELAEHYILKKES